MNHIYIQNIDKNADFLFFICRQHRLFKPIHDKIPALMDLNSEETLKLLLDFQVHKNCPFIFF